MNCSICSSVQAFENAISNVKKRLKVGNVLICKTFQNAKKDKQNPSIPSTISSFACRRKRTKPTELIRPLEVLAAANAAAAAAARAASGRAGYDHMPDNLSCLAAAAAAESESDSDLASAPEYAPASSMQSGALRDRRQQNQMPPKQGILSFLDLM